MSGRVVKNAPYSADIVTESTQTLPDGNHIRQSTTAKFFRDSEGRTRSEQSVNLNGFAAGANLPQLTFINDPVAGVNYALNARDRTATKSNWMPRGHGGRTAGSLVGAAPAAPALPDQQLPAPSPSQTTSTPLASRAPSR